jgi:hypothetical protein
MGDACKFKHSYRKSLQANISPSSSGSNRTAPAPRTRTKNDPLDDLKVMLKHFKGSLRFTTIRDFEKFIQLSHSALELPNREFRSKAVTILSEEEDGAREVVCYIAKRVGHTLPPFVDLNFEQHIAPFLELLVHDSFTRTCVEKNLIYLMTAVYGNGERGDKFLNRIVGMLEEGIRNIDTDDEVMSAQGHCFLISQVFHNLVRRNADAAARKKLAQYHARLIAIANDIRRTRSPSIGRIDIILSQTAAYLFPTIATRGGKRGSPSHLRRRNRQFNQLEIILDFPGRLSRSGPRHDNDSDILREIRILPTKNEILSSRPEYLPINDHSAPHFLEGAARLIDIHFRLLREDMVGPMRAALKVILDQTKSSNSFSNALSQFESRRDPVFSSTCLFFKVSVNRISFDKQRGLIFHLRFQQPNRYQRLSSRQRVDYWKSTRSLGKESLLCLVSKSLGLHCFLTVVDKDEKRLGKDAHWCEIDVSFVDGDASAQGCAYSLKRLGPTTL